MGLKCPAWMPTGRWSLTISCRAGFKRGQPHGSCTPLIPVAQNSRDNSGTSPSNLFLQLIAKWQQRPETPVLVDTTIHCQTFRAPFDSTAPPPCSRVLITDRAHTDKARMQKRPDPRNKGERTTHEPGSMQNENSKNPAHETMSGLMLLYKPDRSLDKSFKVNIKKLLRKNLIYGQTSIYIRSDHISQFRKHWIS